MRFKKVGIQAVKPFLSRTKTVGNTTCIAKIIFVVGSQDLILQKILSRN